MSYQTEIEEILKLADALEAGPEQEKYLEKAIQLAQFHNDPELEFRAKTEYVSCVVTQSYPQKALVVFPWLLAQLDQQSGYLRKWRTLWQYKWMLCELPAFYTISKQQILAVFQDVERRYLAFGEARKTLDYLGWELFMEMGDPEASREYFEKYQNASEGRERLMDCTACMCNSEVDYWISQGDFEKAIQAAEPIMEGQMSCTTVPKTTYSKIVFAHLALNQPAQAEDAYKKGLRQLKPGENDLSCYRYYLLYMALNKRFTKAVSAVEEQIIHALASNGALNSFYFYLSAWLLFEKIAQSTKKQTIKLQLPEAFPLYQPEQTYPLNQLVEWFREQAQSYAQQFDLRNENNYYSRQISLFQKILS